jgi:hypothetical protein
VPQEHFSIRHRKVFRIEDWKRTWQNKWDDYDDTINDDEVTIIEKDGEGQRSSKTYPKWTLLVQSVTRVPVWKDGKLWFKRTIILRHNKYEWIVSQPDMGLNKRNASATPPYEPIMDEDEKLPVSEPQKLNGEGLPFPTAVTGRTYAQGDTFYLDFRKNDESDVQDLIDG